jgi:hypothetical protein
LEELTSYDLKNENGEFTNKKIRKTRFKFLKFLDKGHNIVIYIDESPARTNVFKKFVEKLIPMNNRTRWNN